MPKQESKSGWLKRKLGGGRFTGGITPEGSKVHQQRLLDIAPTIARISGPFGAARALVEDYDGDLQELRGRDLTDHTLGHHRLGEGDTVSIDSWESHTLGVQELEDGKFMTGQDDTVPCDVVGSKRDKKEGRKSKKKKWWA